MQEMHRCNQRNLPSSWGLCRCRRESSFSGAGRRRGRTPSSIGRQIDALEAYLDTPLFLRSTRHLTLTDAGETLLIRARQILDSLVDTQQELASMKGEVTGVLRVACYPTFGKRYVLPVMAKLSRQYPELSFDLDLTERLADPVAERLDVVIRIGDMADSTLIASKIATQIRVLCASPAYLENTGVPASLDEIVSHRLIDKLHGADLLCWSSVIGHPARENTTYPCLAVMISKQCVRRRLKGWVSRSCRTGWREMTLTVARSSTLPGTGRATTYVHRNLCVTRITSPACQSHGVSRRIA
jgi:DNA-binding transcriptional LysR family regulator